MGSKLSQYDYSILTLKCVNLIQEKTTQLPRLPWLLRLLHMLVLGKRGFNYI